MALSSTSSTRLPVSSLGMPAAAARAGTSAGSAVMVKWNVEPSPAHALHPHRAAHQLGQALADREAEAGAAVLARGRRVELAELLEQAVGAIGRDADAGVADGDVQLVGLAAGLGGEHHLAGVGELHRVAQQVHQHLAEPGDVAAQAFGKGRIDEEGELEPLARRRLGDQVERRLDARPQVERDAAPAPGGRRRSWRSRGCR